MWNWSYYSRDKRFHAWLCASPRITRGLSESTADVRFTGSDVSSVEHVNRGTGIQGKSMRIQYTNQWLPRVSVFPHVSLRAYREQAGRRARVDRHFAFSHCERYFSASVLDLFQQNVSSNVIYFQVNGATR